MLSFTFFVDFSVSFGFCATILANLSINTKLTDFTPVYFHVLRGSLIQLLHHRGNILINTLLSVFTGKRRNQ